MAITVVQSCGNFTNSDTANVGITASFSGNTTAGNILVVAGMANSGSGLAVSDTSGDTFTQIYQTWLGTGTNLLQVWVSSPIAGGNTGGINVQKAAGTTNVEVIAYELSGVATDLASPVDQKLDSTSTSPPSVGPVQTTYGNELAILFSGQSPGAAPTTQTVGSSATNLTNQMASVTGLSGETLALGATADRMTGSTTTVAFGSTVSNSDTVLITLVPDSHTLFKPMSFQFRGNRPAQFTPGLGR